MVQGAPQVAGRFPELLRQYKAPPPEISSRAVLRDRSPRAASRAASRSRPSGRCRSTGPSTSSPTATGATRCASTCATTTTGRRSALLCELLPRAREPRDARRRDRRARHAVARSTTPSATTTARTSPTRKRVLERIWEAAGAQDTLTHRPLRPPGRRLPHGHRRPRTASSTPTTASGASPTCSSATAA